MKDYTMRRAELRSRITQDLLLDEGEVLQAYLCPAGKLTIGVGRNLESPGLSQDEAIKIGSDRPKTITVEQSRMLLNNDIDRIEHEISMRLPWIKALDDVRYSAFFNMLFQFGLSRFQRFKKTLEYAQAQEWEQCADEMLDSKWAREDSPRRARKYSERVRTGRWV